MLKNRHLSYGLSLIILSLSTSIPTRSASTNTATHYFQTPQNTKNNAPINTKTSIASPTFSPTTEELALLTILDNLLKNTPDSTTRASACPPSSSFFTTTRFLKYVLILYICSHFIEFKNTSEGTQLIFRPLSGLCTLITKASQATSTVAHWLNI